MVMLMEIVAMMSRPSLPIEKFGYRRMSRWMFPEAMF